MGTTINSYSVGLGMDAKGYIDGARLSRTETKALIKDIEGARSPTENFAREQDRLTAALDKGAISTETYQRLLDKKKTSLLGATSSLNGYSAGLTAAAAVGTAAIASGVAFVAHLRATQEQIDSTIDSSKKLGMSFNEVGAIRFAAQEAGGTDAASVDANMKKMLVNISKAVNGDEGIREAFKDLGVDAGEMLKLGPVDAIMKIADGMQGVSSHAEKLRLAMDIFGKSGHEMIPLLNQGSDAIKESVGFQQRWNALTEEQTTTVAANNDSWDRVGIIVTGVSNTLAAEFAPAMLLAAEYIIDSADGFEHLKSGMESVVDTTVYWVGVLKDAIDIGIVLTKLANRDLVGVYKTMGAAIDLSSGQRALEALHAKREELEKLAKENQANRDKERENLAASEAAMQDTAAEKADKKQKERDEKHAQLESKRIADRVQKMMDDDAEFYEKKERHEMELALKAANKHFEDEAKKTESRKKDFQSKGASGIEVGSAESAKFMAEQWKQNMGDKLLSEKATPGEKELIEEAKKQLATMKKQAEIDEKILAELKNNGFKRIR